MKQLAADNPGLVRTIVLPNKTWLRQGRHGHRDHQGRQRQRRQAGLLQHGRPPRARVAGRRDADGVGLRARQRLQGRRRPRDEHRREQPQHRSSRSSTPTASTPPARRARSAGGGSGRDPSIPDTAYIISGAANGGEYRRKNCRLPDDSDAGNCATSAGLAEPGVDPNRNYGQFWGGPGADTNPATQTYRGKAPFSEPESRNVQDYVSKHHVMSLITNHTTAALVLRAPGLAVARRPDRRGQGLQGARRRHGQAERLLLPEVLRALRHDGDHGGLDLQRHRRLRLHDRDLLRRAQLRDGRLRRSRLPPDLQHRRRGRVERRQRHRQPRQRPRAERRLRRPGHARGVLRRRRERDQQGAPQRARRAPRPPAPRCAWRSRSRRRPSRRPTASRSSSTTSSTRSWTSPPTASTSGTSTRRRARSSPRRVARRAPARRARSRRRRAAPPGPPTTPTTTAPTVPTTPRGDPASRHADPTATNYNDHPFAIPATGDNAASTSPSPGTRPPTDWDIELFEDINGDGKSDGGDTLRRDLRAGRDQRRSRSRSSATRRSTPGKKYVLRVRQLPGRRGLHASPRPTSGRSRSSPRRPRAGR